MKRLIRIFLILAYIAWVAGWMRAFGISFSPGFFHYHQGMRLIGLILSLLSIAVPPLTGYWAVSRTLRQNVGALKALAINLVVSGLPVFMFWAVHAVWLRIARRRGELAFEADEAMAIGIEYLLCLAAFLVANIIVLGIIVDWKLLKRKRKDARHPYPELAACRLGSGSFVTQGKGEPREDQTQQRHRSRSRQRPPL